MAKIALLIGVSEYSPGLNPLPAAVNDVEAIKRVLHHPDIGGFSESNITVLKNPARQAMEEAIEALFSHRHKDDLVILFFSGHGIKDDSGLLYLGTSQTRKTDKGELVRTSSVAANLIHQVMENSRSRRQVVILDCCFSGAFAEGMRAKNDASVDINSQLGGEGRAVLTSSTATQYSFEQQGSDLSIYTRYLVEGIEQGTADSDKDGIISVDELHEFARKKVQEVSPSMKPAIFAVREGYKIQLAKVILKNQKYKPQGIREKIDFGVINFAQANTQSQNRNIKQNQASFLHNFIEPYESFISDLIRELSNINNSPIEQSYVQYFILNIIRLVSKADFVFILCNEKQNDWFLKLHSDLSEDINRESYINTLNTIIFPTISQASIFNPAHHGIYKIHQDSKGVSEGFLFIPLKSRPEGKIIVICGFSPDAYLLEDIYGRILSSFYEYSQKFKLQPDLVEAGIIDDLKKSFGFVSASLYERRFHLFRNRLQQMIVYFEPIIHLDPRELFISGWEALARNPQDSKAPSDLFHAAELWGPRFMIELDQYFLVLASKTYREALKKAKQNRPNEIVPLSVNVYPESLMRTAYYDKVREIIHDKVISPRHLILEISEKTEIPKFNNGIYINQPLQSFEKLLLRYVREFKIRFSIDDFGVGYASVSRLAGLNPSYVKIDREILYHEPTEVIIRFVHELVQANSLRDRTDVIVEGVDENTPISLRKLREIGVSYIQGYMVGKATSDIYRLTSEKADFFRNKLLQP